MWKGWLQHGCERKFWLNTYSQKTRHFSLWALSTGSHFSLLFLLLLLLPLVCIISLEHFRTIDYVHVREGRLGNDHLTWRGGYGFFLKKYSDSQCCWKKYSDFGGEKKKSDSEFLSYNLMLNSGKKIRDKNKKYFNSRVVGKKNSEQNKKP